MATSIPGIDSLRQGVELSNEGYNIDTVPQGYTKFRDSINDYTNSGLQVKFLKKDNIKYVLVAGTNDLDIEHNADEKWNWPSKGKIQFNVLDPVLRQVIIQKQGDRVFVFLS